MTTEPDEQLPVDQILFIAEIPYESGAIRFRYSRILSEDGTRWMRHGLFVEYHETGAVASEVEYVRGIEHGVCRDYHPNGVLAAEGQYHEGKEHGLWRFWSEDGREERACMYRNGAETDA
jgi:antitoxin component YwqK of YwqJK toxin-antitoxin module